LRYKSTKEYAEAELDDFQRDIFTPVQVQHTEYKKLLSDCREKAVGLAKMYAETGGAQGLNIPLKRMGELDPQAMSGMRVESISEFQALIHNTAWQPFRVLLDQEGRASDAVRDDDVQLQRLRKLGGETAVCEVVRARRQVEAPFSLWA
jgi:hypothetical protein